MIVQAERQRLLIERIQIAAQRKIELERRRAARQAALSEVAARESEANDESADVQKRLSALSTVLRDSLSRSPAIDFAKLKVRPKLPSFDAHRKDVASRPPSLDEFLPQPISFWARLIPPLVSKYEQSAEEAKSAFDNATAQWRESERVRIAELDRLKAEYRTACASAEQAAAQENDDVDRFQADYSNHEREAVINYFELVIEGDVPPQPLPTAFRVTYVAESKQLVVERQLPTLDVLPQEIGFKYVRKTDRIEPIKRKLSELRGAYSDLLAQLVLRLVSLIARADKAASVDVIALNGYVDTIDPATGNRVRPTLVSLSVSTEALDRLALDHVEPMACLRSLKALVSPSAHELAAVRPLVSFDMADRRFIDKGDVLSELDSRPNLAELSPSEFETLMTNLFEKMGLETRLTQASRDGGVDCVAWDMRPVVGGKVVIQAKRYKNTVGVSAVRDLYGTMMNEGASKGILVTTSGYGPTAYEFAKNKPITLISGGNLVSMLSEYAHVEAKIAFPEDWKDEVTAG